MLKRGHDARRAARSPLEPHFAWTPEDVIAFRDFLRWSQAELAERIGTRQQTISDWELGKHRPNGMSKRTLDRLAAETRFYGGETAGLAYSRSARLREN